MRIPTPLFFLLLPLAAAAASPVSNVSAQQRFPWNGLVDITFRLDASAIVTVSATDAETGTTGFSLNFEPFLRQRLPGKDLLSDEGSTRLLLGMDALAAPDEGLPGSLDDVCVYRKTLTDEDLARLKAYYME